MKIWKLKKRKSSQVSLGERGEMLGWSYLVKRGYEILEKNYRCPLGEIDVIAQKEGRLVFIEIKTRTQDRFGRPEEAVTCGKQKKLLTLSQWYLKSKKKLGAAVAFEVLAIRCFKGCEPEIRLIENAFSVDVD